MAKSQWSTYEAGEEADIIARGLACRGHQVKGIVVEDGEMRTVRVPNPAGKGNLPICPGGKIETTASKADVEDVIATYRARGGGKGRKK